MSNEKGLETMRQQLFVLVMMLTILSCTRPCSAQINVSKNEVDHPTVTVNDSTSRAANDDYSSSFNLAEYQGIYLPKIYLDDLKRSKCHNHAFNHAFGLIKLSVYLEIKENKIWGNINYCNEFAKTTSEIAMFDFTDAENGIIKDEKNNEYNCIFSENNYPRGNILFAIRKYINKVLFEKNKYSDDDNTHILIVEDNGSVTIDRAVYVLDLNTNFTPSVL